jgi:SAM-dependent methyltransferase
VKPGADHFSRVASAYADCRPGYPPELLAYIADIPYRHELAWDCATGSGQAAVPLAARFRRVLATDVSQEMLDQAPRHPRVEYRPAPAHQSGLAESTTDLVTVAQALHWLDLRAFYAEVERVLVPGGVLAVWSYGSQLLGDDTLDSILAHFYNRVVGPYWPAERRHVEAGYSTLQFPYTELTTPTFRMEERWTLPQLIGYVATWSATERFREIRGYDPVTQLAGDLEPVWGDPAVPRPVHWPLSLRIGRKQG